MATAEFNERKKQAIRALERALRTQDMAKAEGRSLTDDERLEIDLAQSEAARFRDDARHGDSTLAPGKRQTDTPYRPGQSDEERERERNRATGNRPIEWRDSKTGAVARSYAKGVSVRDNFWSNPPAKFERDNPEDYNLGRYVRAWLLGKRNEITDAEARALSTSSNSGGGYMVPDPIAAQWIDAARNLSVAFRLGMQTVEMTSGTLTVARVSSDPTIATKSENDSWTATAPALDAITLTAHTLGAVVDVAEELIMDAPNAADLIETSLIEATANEIDRQVLAGSANMEMASPFSLSEALSTGSVGSITYDDLLDAIKLLWDENATPNGYATTPTIANTLAKLKAGDGSTSAALYYSASAGLPAEVAALTRLTTNQAESGCLYLADWTKLLLGVRLDITLERTREAGDRWNKFQSGFRVAWRGDCSATRANHLHKLSGAS